MPKIIAIHSYRGGTGKSNLTANLAVTIALQGKRVAIVDTDLQSPGIHTLFGFNEKNLDKTLNDYLWKRCSIQGTAHDVSFKAGIEGKGQIFLIPASVNAEEIARILSEGYNASLLNEGFRCLIKSLQLDYLFLDTHPGLNRETLLSIAIANLLIIILRPDQQDYQGTAVTLEVAHQLKVRNLMLVINKVLSTMNGSMVRQTVEAAHQASVAGIFPFSEAIAALGSCGLFCIQYPDHPFTQILNQIAAQVIEQPSLLIAHSPGSLINMA